MSRRTKNSVKAKKENRKLARRILECFEIAANKAKEQAEWTVKEEHNFS